MRTHLLQPAEVLTEHTKTRTSNAVPVLVPAGDVRLRGELRVPAHAAGVVIFAGPNAHCAAATVVECGNAALILDLLSEQEQREDRFTSGFRFDAGLLAGRFVTVTRWLANHPDTARLGFGFYGSGIAGAAALAAAAELAVVVDAVVCRDARPDFAANQLPRVEAATLLICDKADQFTAQINQSAMDRLHCEKQLQLLPSTLSTAKRADAGECLACSLAAAWFRSHVRAR